MPTRLRSWLLASLVALSGVLALPAASYGERAYEMVSPLDKNGGEINRNVLPEDLATSGAAASGDAVVYASTATFAGTAGGAPFSQYRSVRGPGGWSTRGINPLIDPEPGYAVSTPHVLFLSEDVSKTLVITNAGLTPDADALLGGSYGLYRQDHSGPTSTSQLVSRPFAALPNDPILNLWASRFAFVGASRDMNHVVFNSLGRQLTPDGLAPTDPNDPQGLGVYEWANGQVRFVSFLPGTSQTPAPQARAGAREPLTAAWYPGDHPISDDGQRIFFTADVSATEPTGLFVREGGTTTRAVSASERAGDDPTIARPAFFYSARAADGGLALFSSDTPLATGAVGAGNLYLWRADAATGQHLTTITTGDSNGGQVLGVAAASEDLTRVYFVAMGVLASGGQAGEPNLYLWQQGEGVRHVVTLASGSTDAAVWSSNRLEPTELYRDARLSADGSRLAFASFASLTSFATGGHKQIYLYDPESAQLTCASCDSRDGTSDGDASFFALQQPPGVQRPSSPYRLPRNLSADGSRLVFETTEKLVARDTNVHRDVYVWEAGQLDLISTGRGAGPSELIDASANGDDVFFTTRERLTAADCDNQMDVYDARVNGGFAALGPPVPCKEDESCQGDVCQGSLSGQPLFPAPRSTEPRRGDVNLGRRAAFSVKRLSSRQRAQLARGRKVTLSVRVNRAARVTATAKARVGKRSRTVLSASKRAARAGVVRLRLGLSRAGLGQLDRRGTLALTLTVRVAGAVESQVSSLRLGSKRGGQR